MTRATPKPHLISPEENLVFDAEAGSLSSVGLTLAMASIYNPS